MKVLFVTHRYPPRTGGVETHVHEIATRLVDRGHDVTVFSADDGADVSSVSTDEGVRIRRFRSLNPGGAFFIAPQMALAVRRAEVDVVHAHNYHALPVLFGAVGVSNKKFIITPHYHGESVSGVRDALLSFYSLLGKWSLEQADEVIAVSHWERQRLRDNYGINATVIPNGVRVERYSNAEPLERSGPYLLYVGRLEQYKGVQYIIQSLSKLPEYDLVIGGRGPHREALEAVATHHGVADRVDFLGFVDDDKLPGLYAGAEVFLNLSSLEAYGMTVAEALAAGTPCVVRNEKALQDWTAHEGCVGVSNFDPSSVSSAVLSARERTVDRETLPRWSDVVDRVAESYLRSAI